MMGDLEGAIFFIPFFYMAIYLVAYVCMKRRLP
ncbi:hypothetical protein M2305_000124 [Gluconobacter cerinus]|nr:hypothetical protein [Gluconobacter cerinus]